MTKPLKSGFLTLIGLPNAGKSSLLNALVGEELAIVTPKAQTTWQLLRGYVMREDLELVVTDTPGLQEGTKALNAAFGRAAIREINPAGEKFDPHLHQAMQVVDSDLPPNTVVTVFQKGYLLNDRVLRPALVTVSKAQQGS